MKKLTQNIGQRTRGRDITPHPLYLALGPDDATRQVAYRTLFRHQLDDEAITESVDKVNKETLFRHQLDDEAIADIRLALNQSQPLGSDRFADQISAATGIRREQKRRGRPQGKTHPSDSMETQPDFGF